jgi:hypothetical protein
MTLGAKSSSVIFVYRGLTGCKIPALEVREQIILSGASTVRKGPISSTNKKENPADC